MQTDFLGRYEILETLTAGVAGRVFLARDPSVDRRVVIQTLDVIAEMPADVQAETRERLLRSLAEAVGLSHPRIARLLEIDEAQGLPFLVSEHVEGTPLSAYCEPQARLPTGQAVELVARAAEALDQAHRAGVAHGDLRPETLLRQGQDEVKLTGFGLATALRIGTDDARAPSNYTSPELLRDGQVGAAGDQFSLGAVLYELLTGERAFPGDSASSVLYRIVHEEPRDPAEAGVHPALCDVLSRALAKQPERRFGSAGELATALRATADLVERTQPAAPAASAIQEPAGAAPAPPSAPASSSSARPYVVGIVLFAVAGAVGYWLFGGGVGLPPEAPWWETRVSTEPAGLEVRIDGVLLNSEAAGLVRYRGEEPFPLLTVQHACRDVEHRLSAADAGGDLVLVIDPLEADVQIDPQIAGASVRLNGKNVGSAPLDLRLDLCRANELKVQAAGFRPASIKLPTGAKPLDVRKQVYAIALEPIPRGRLVLPRQKGLELAVYVDGRRIKDSVGDLELEEGKHELRVKNEYHWLDRRKTIEIVGGKTARPKFDLSFGKLVVQAFPANCKVYLRRPGGSWKFLDETPAERSVATGRMQVKVELNPTGETRIEEVTLSEGVNPPLRVAFGRRS